MSFTEAETGFLGDRCLYTDILFNEVCKLTVHIVDGPVSPFFERWTLQSRILWSRVTRALQRVFRNKCVEHDVSCGGRRMMSTKLLDAISTRCINALRMSIKGFKRRLHYDADEHIDFCIHIATILKKYTFRLKHFLVRGHSWDQMHSHNCTCCNKMGSQVKQSGVIEQLGLLLRAALPWPSVFCPVPDLD